MDQNMSLNQIVLFFNRLAIPVVRVGRQRGTVLLLHQQGEDDEGCQAWLRQTPGSHYRDR